jgi:hypothetical protein
MLLMLQGGEMLQFSQLYLYGPTVVILAMVLAFMLRALPTWRVMKTRELDIRELEAAARSKEADALTSLGGSLAGLGNALNQNSQVLGNVAIEQRRATDAIRLLQRVNGDSTERLRVTVEDLVSRMADMERDRNETEESRPNSH